MVTGRGLTGALKQKFPHWVLLVVAVALFFANTINIGADLSGMADAAEMLTGLPAHFSVLLFGIIIAYATIRFRYNQIASILKWLSLTLFAYVITAFIVKPEWKLVFRDTFVPSWPKGHETWPMLVAILGTTISPYLFFWQTSQEVEEDKAAGKRKLTQRRNASISALQERKLDVGMGTFFSNLVMYFIILTTALTLHKNGMTHVETSAQAANALAPLAGKFASLIFTLGIIGVGMLAIPTLAGSAAYAFAEVFRWRQGLDAQFRGAHQFYIVIAVSILCGIFLVFTKVSPVKALYLTAIINGSLAPFLLVGILLVASDHRVMCGQSSSKVSIIVVAITTVAMFAAAIGMFVF
jgi:Mn2+/Fe2+ NRAMP family transporter